MSHNEPTLGEWKDLYEAAKMFKELAPWQWMKDADVFGVENPESGEIGYCCVLGSIGELYGFFVYLGSEGLDLYEGIQSGRIAVDDEDLFAKQKCLAITFDDRDVLNHKDFEIIKSLGLKFRGRQSWPCFRSHLPGFMPWCLTGVEARFLRLALRQAIGVAERFREYPDILTPAEQGTYLVAFVTEEGGKAVWREKWYKPAPFEMKRIQVPIDEVRSARIKTKSQMVESAWEVDFFYAPFVVREGERPFYPYISLYTAHNEYYVLNFCLAPHAGFEKEFLENFLAFLENVKMLPRTIMVKKDVVYDFFKPVTESLGVSLKKVRRLAANENVKNSMIQSMMR